MPIDVPTPDRIAMSQKERDVLKTLHGVLQGEQTQAQPPVDGGMVLSIEVPLAVEREGRIHRDSAFRLPDYLIALP